MGFTRAEAAGRLTESTRLDFKDSFFGGILAFIEFPVENRTGDDPQGHQSKESLSATIIIIDLSLKFIIKQNTKSSSKCDDFSFSSINHHKLKLFVRQNMQFEDILHCFLTYLKTKMMKNNNVWISYLKQLLVAALILSKLWLFFLWIQVIHVHSSC